MADHVEQFIQTQGELSAEDDDLVHRIRAALWKYEPLRATRPHLEVGVENGRVTVSGRVRTLAIKEISEYLLRRLEGVRAVRNDLVADPEVVRAVADALGSDPDLGPLCIRVDARDGDVVLAGDVPSEVAGNRALDVASRVPLAARIDNRLTVRTGATNGSITMPTPPERSSEPERSDDGV